MDCCGIDASIGIQMPGMRTALKGSATLVTAAAQRIDIDIRLGCGCQPSHLLLTPLQLVRCGPKRQAGLISRAGHIVRLLRLLSLGLAVSNSDTRRTRGWSE